MNRKLAPGMRAFAAMLLLASLSFGAALAHADRLRRPLN